MGTKYIIEVEDKPFELLSENGLTSEKLFRVKGFNSLVFDWNGLNMLTPYTEPDLEQVRKEAYEKGQEDLRKSCVPKDEEAYGIGYHEGFQQGLGLAWEAARKISSMDSRSRDEIFGLVIISNIFDENTASEAIEKIRQYEQEKEEQIQVGDEVKNGDEKYIVLQKYLNNIDEPMAVLFNRRDMKIDKWHLYNGDGAIFKKTGRQFPEIVEVLQNMKEEA